MGRKRGVHITGVKRLLVPSHLFIISYTRSKCKYARVRMGVVAEAKDELDAALKFKRRNNK